MVGQGRKPRFIDIGVNFTDPVFRGIHRGRQKHPDDFNHVIRRSVAAGVKSVIITGGSLRESREALKLAKNLGVFATAGCHPTRSSEFDKFKGGPAAYLSELDKLISYNLKGPGRVVAIGECGLDYDRLHFANKLTQQKHFRSQLALAKKHSLPLFLHSRAAHKDFVQILTEEGLADDGGRKVGARGGVVHSFTGTAEEIQELTAMGFYISINGCGLKTTENLSHVATVPLERLLLETDAPWCSLTSAHASNSFLTASTITPSSQKKPFSKKQALAATPQSQSQRQNLSPETETQAQSSSKPLDPSLSALYNPQPRCAPDKFVPGRPVKGRNEPCAIGLVAHVLAQLKGVELGVLTEHAWRNTIELFALETRGRSGEDAGGEGGNDHDDELLETMGVPEQAADGATMPPSLNEFDIKKEEWPSL